MVLWPAQGMSVAQIADLADAVAGLASAQHVAGVGERLLDRPPGGITGHQCAGGRGQVGGDQGQVIAAGRVLVAGQDQAHGAAVTLALGAPIAGNC